MESFTVNFELEHETKNAVRFAEIDAKGKRLKIADAIIGTIYIKKSQIGKTVPSMVSVTFAVADKKKGAKVEKAASAPTIKKAVSSKKKVAEPA